MVKAKIMMIGSNLKGVETKLKYSGIECTEFINLCNPLSMAGAFDESLLDMSSQTNNMHTHLDIKKNLAQMLSKDPNNFVQNYNYMPYAKNVEYCNTSDYIIVNNIGLAYEIYTNGEYIYTVHEKNDFTDYIKTNNSYKKVYFPFDNSFDWKSLYDKFIDAILSAYDSKHIILLKTHCSSYYLNGTDINEFSRIYTECREILNEADDYFALRTSCITVDEAYNHIPVQNDFRSLLPSAEYSDVCVDKIFRIIERIVLNGIIPPYSGNASGVDEIISVYNKYIKSKDIREVTKEITDILASGLSLPINSAKLFCEKNIEFLSEYAYISNSLKKPSSDENVYIRLGNDVYFVLNLNSNEPIYKKIFSFSKDIDYSEIKENEYTCSIEQADLLCKSLSFYIERARHGDGNKPIKISFGSYKEFCESLNYIDYTDLLENEYFLIGLKGENFNLNGYKARCNLDFFFDKNVKICMIDNGFTNQIIYYIFSKRLENYTGSVIYYDDLVYCFDYIMNGLEINKVIKENISSRLFSNIFTPKLLSNFKIGDVVADKLSEHGLDDLLVIANNNEELGDAVKKCNKLCLCSIQHDFMDKIFSCGFYPMYFRYFIRPEWLMNLRYFELRQYIEFPKMEGKNKDMEKMILGCDAVVIHIRRGDFVGLGWDTDTSFYLEAITKLLVVSDYPNKKYFVFSDDIPWVKNHEEELGINLVDGSDVIYVDHNKGNDSYLDMYLISLAKVVISSGSGFARTAALLGTRCQDFIYGVEKAVKMYEMVGKKNKHKISIENKVILDYSNVLSVRENTRKQNSI